MNSTLAGWLQFLLLFAALAACYIPLGNYIARIFTDKKHWRVERGIYKLTGIDPDADMRWTVYVRSILAFSILAFWIQSRVSTTSPAGIPGLLVRQL